MKDWWRTLSFALYFLFCVWIVQGWKVWQISHLSCLQASAFQLRLYSHTCKSPLFEYVCEVHLACAWCMPCSHACAYVFVCVHSSMCACPLGSTGVLSDNTNSPPPLSNPDRTVSWSQQLAAPSAVQHGRKKKKISTSDFFAWCQLDDIRLTLPCLHRVHEIKPHHWPQNPQLQHTFPLYLHTLFQPHSTTAAWPWQLFFVLLSKKTT